MTQRLDKINKHNEKVRGPNSNLDINRPKVQHNIKMKQVPRTKWDVYNYPSLRIAENQG